MNQDPNYLKAAVKWTREGINHFLLRDREEERDSSAMQFRRAVEQLMRQKLLKLGDGRHAARLNWGQFKKALREDHKIEINTDLLDDLSDARHPIEHTGGTIDPENFYRLVYWGVFPFLVDFYEDKLSCKLSELFEEHHLALLEHAGLPPAKEAEILSSAAWRYVHDDPKLSIGFARRALDLGLREWGRSIGVDDPGLGIIEYLDHWHRFIDSRPPDDTREGLCTPHYFNERGDDQNIGASFFRSYESFQSSEEVGDYLTEVHRAVKHILYMAKQGISKTYQELKWEEAIRNNKDTILNKIERISPKTARVLREVPVQWEVSGGSLHISDLLAELFNVTEVDSTTSSASIPESLSTEELMLKGFDIDAIRSAICTVIRGFPKEYPITASVGVKHMYLLEGVEPGDQGGKPGRDGS